MEHQGHEHEHHRDPALAAEGEIVGRPTMLVRFKGQVDAQQVLDSLTSVRYPLKDVAVLFRLEGGDQVVNQLTGHVAAGQSLTDEELARHKEGAGQTLVLLHPDPQQAEAVRGALSRLGELEIDYTGETHAFGGSLEVERKDEPVELAEPIVPVEPTT